MKPLVILTGPTAVGKTKLSIALAKEIGGEIISADSMQVYKKMDIGTAKITKEEMCGIPHYLVDELDPGEEFNVVRFQSMAKQAMEQIYQKGKIPILVGGTGFYIQAIVKDIDFTSNDDSKEYRKTLEKMAEEKGNQYLHQMLQEVDPNAALAIHPNNVKKVIRALEFHQQTGACISEHNDKEAAKKSPYDFHYFVLTDEREKLYHNIEKRIELMIEQGLVEEVKRLKEEGYTLQNISMQGLGYKEIFAYLNGEITLEEAIYILKRDTRHFAKRQLTWFRREEDVVFIPKYEFEYDDQKILSFMKNKMNYDRRA